MNTIARFASVPVIALAIGFASLSFGCHPASSQQKVATTEQPNVARHFIVLVTEVDPQTKEPRDSLVIGEPLEYVPESRSAFSFANGSYRIGLAWDSAPAGDRCLAVTVARAGDPRLPDFNASGCVPTTGPTATIAEVARPNGGPIEIVAWFFTADAPPRKGNAPLVDL